MLAQPGSGAKLIPTRATLKELAQAVCLCTLRDDSVEARELFNLAFGEAGKLYVPAGASFLPPKPGIWGVNMKDRRVRMGEFHEVRRWLAEDCGRPLLADHSLPDSFLVADDQGDVGFVASRFT